MAENLPEPKSRKESYLAKAAGMSVEVPEKPESREEQYLAAIAEGGGGGGGSYTAGEGIDITSNTISVDTTTIQEKLTAGTGIDITDNTISATGGGGDTVYSDKNTSSSSTGGAVYIGNLDSSQQEQPDPTTTDYHWKYFWALPYYNNKIPSADSINIMGNSDGVNNKTNFIVIGKEATVYDSQAIAIGGFARADGQSVAIGYTAQAGNWSGKYGMVAIGSNANASEAEYSIHIGGNTGNSYGVKNANSKASIAIGKHSKVGTGASGFKNSVALGSYAQATRQGELNIGLVTGETTGGYNDTAYRVIGGVHDPVDDHDAATKGYVDAHSGGVTPVQTTGTSTTDVMSQNATTAMVFPLKETANDDMVVSVGKSTVTIAGTQATTIGYDSSASANKSCAFGAHTIGGGDFSVALGAGAEAYNNGEVNISTGTLYATSGYNSSNYRLLSGVYDGQSAHDAVTVGQVNAVIDAINTALSTNISHIGA